MDIFQVKRFVTISLPVWIRYVTFWILQIEFLIEFLSDSNITSWVPDLGPLRTCTYVPIRNDNFIDQLRWGMIMTAILFTIRMESKYDLSYDSTPTLYLYSSTDHINRSQLNTMITANNDRNVIVLIVEQLLSGKTFSLINTIATPVFKVWWD